MAQKKRVVMQNAIERPYAEMLDEFFANGGRVTKCPPAGVADDEDWHSLRDYLEPYKTSPVESSRWSVGSDIAFAIRESAMADTPMDEGEN